MSANISGLEMISRFPGEAINCTSLIEAALEAFGPDRLMLGSNWLASVLRTTYRNIWSAYDEALAGLSDA